LVDGGVADDPVMTIVCGTTGFPHRGHTTGFAPPFDGISTFIPQCTQATVSIVPLHSIDRS
jgi:hypothetical protein